jgi:hypothetical protein
MTMYGASGSRSGAVIDHAGILLKLIFCLLLSAIPSVAQDNTGEIIGKVVNARDSEPLALVQVELAGTMFRVITGDDGTFRLTGVPPGDYVLQSTTVNFYPVKTPVTLEAGETRTVNVALAASTTKIAENVEVSEDVFDAAPEPTASGFTLAGDERKNLASVLADDPLRAVQNLPGVTSNNDFSSEFSVRGAPFHRVGLYLDRVLLHSPFHTTDGQADNGSLTVFNGDLTDDITLYQGAWPVKFSDRTAGVLDVQTREGSREGIHGKVSVSASNAGVTVEGPVSKKRGAWLVDYRKSYLQYILNHIDFGDQPPLAFAFDDVQGRFDFDLTPHHAFSLTALEGSSSVDRTEFRSELGPNTVMTSGYRFSLVNLGYRYTPSPRLLIQNHLAWSHENGHVENRDDAPLNGGMYTEWTWHSDATVNWKKKGSLDFGGEFRHLHQDSISTQYIYAPEITPSTDASRANGNQGGAYVQQSWSIASGRARFAAGIREDAHNAGISAATSPYASVSLQPLKRTHLQFDWGMTSQYPELNQIFSLYAVTSLHSEHATHYEAAVEERLNDRMRLHVEFYDRRDERILARPALDPRLVASGPDFIVIDAQPAAALLNSQHGYARGIEIYLQRRSANGFNGWVSYAFGRAIVTDDTLQVTFPSDYDQHHTFNAYASRRIRPTVNVSGRLTLGSGMPLPGFYSQDALGYSLSDQRNALRAPVYQRTDVRLNKAFIHTKVKTTIFGEIVNLTNHQNRDFDSPGPYDPATHRTNPSFYDMLPILPSVGLLLEF